MPVKLKGKIHEAVRPLLLYGAETCSTTKGPEKRREVNEMRMLRWMCGVMKKDKISKSSTSDKEDHREKAEVVGPLREGTEGTTIG